MNPTWIRRIAQSLMFRIVVAALLLGAHVWAAAKLGRERFGIPFDAAPDSPPTFVDPAHEAVPPNWNRLVVSRWDAQHYITLALRGYSTCKPRSELGPSEFPDTDVTCQLGFFPTYPAFGYLASKIHQFPIDYALFGVSLAASFALCLMWTSRSFVESLGIGKTYLSLILLHTFTTGYALVTVQTEPCALALLVFSYVALRKRWIVIGAIAAGLCSAVRITGLATGAAYGLALVWLVYKERPTKLTTWVRYVVGMLLCGWGLAALIAYNHVRFGDALIYFHSRARYYGYSLGPLSFLFPDPKWIVEGICAAPNEAIWLAAGILWFLLGHKRALGRFPMEGRVFFYTLFVLSVGMPIIAQTQISYGGLTRYLLLAIPLFFAMAELMSRRPVLIASWILFSMLHYWNVNLCFYVGQRMPGQMEKCHFGKLIQ